MESHALMRIEHFAPLVGDIFTIIGPLAADTQLTLDTAQALTPHDFPGKQRDPFSLIFSGPPTPFLDQRIYSMTHPVLGDQDIFLVPVAKRADGRFEYQAIFN